MAIFEITLACLVLAMDHHGSERKDFDFHARRYLLRNRLMILLLVCIYMQNNDGGKIKIRSDLLNQIS